MDPPQSPSCSGQVLGKRKHAGQVVMRVQSEFRNSASSSQIVTPRPSSAPATARISFETSTFRFQLPFSAPEAKAPRQTKRDPVARSTFLTATVDCTKKGPRITFESDPTKATSSEISSRNSKQPAKPVEKGNQHRLKPSHPVQTSGRLYGDVWIRILSFCEPRFLLEAKTIDKYRYHLLSEHSPIWKESRLNYYGSDMPECPKDLTEQQYVELLAGRGCQNSRCPRGDTHKVHWIFRVRLCSECTAQKTMRVRCPFTPAQNHPVLTAMCYRLRSSLRDDSTCFLTPATN
jgi:hypothetical protein